MPQVGWEYAGRRWTHEQLMAHAETYPVDFPWAPEMLAAMWQPAERDFVSPSTLGGCVRQVVGKRTTPYYEKPEQVYARWRGTLAHAVLEQAKTDPRKIVEERRGMWIKTPDQGPVLISGQPDLVVPHERLLVDYKTVKRLEKKPKASWVSQLSVYRLMLEHDGIPVERALIQQVHMDETRRLDIPLWSPSQTADWASKRAGPMHLAVTDQFTEDTLPPHLHPALDENHYLCANWCPVAAWCEALHAKGK